MKKVLILAIIAFASCKSNSNELMTKLVNEQKMINDSLPVLQGRVNMLINAMADKKGDSATFMSQAVLINRQIDSLNERLPKVNFSIDSLQKMK